MSGGRFDYDNEFLGNKMDGQWRDPVINELFHDLFCAHNYQSRYGGLALMLDFWLSDDLGEEDYRIAVEAFKAKWFKNQNICKEATERYIDKKVEELKAECLGEVVGNE